MSRGRVSLALAALLLALSACGPATEEQERFLETYGQRAGYAR